MQKTGKILGFVAAISLGSAAPASSNNVELRTLQGTWVMDAAYEIKADGTRITTYGERPDGLMMIDKAGRYSIQIFRPNRTPFKSGSKGTAEPAELREAVLASSTHFGHVTIDQNKSQLIFKIDAASFPNWNGATQVRDFSYNGELLSYQVPAAASGNGTIAYSIWRKTKASSTKKR